MGLRSLIEINHDTSCRLIEDYPSGFVQALNGYVASGSKLESDRLYSRYDTLVVALRHSSDVYYISPDSYGFPARLPWVDHERVRDQTVAKAKEMTGGTLKSKESMKDIILELVRIIERQNEILDKACANPRTTK